MVLFFESDIFQIQPQSSTVGHKEILAHQLPIHSPKTSIEQQPTVIQTHSHCKHFYYFTVSFGLLVPKLLLAYSPDAVTSPGDQVPLSELPIYPMNCLN